MEKTLQLVEFVGNLCTQKAHCKIYQMTKHYIPMESRSPQTTDLFRKMGFIVFLFLINSTKNNTVFKCLITHLLHKRQNEHSSHDILEKNF